MNAKYPSEIRARGGSSKIQGCHARFTLTSRPTWHPDNHGELACAGCEQVLSLELVLPNDLADPTATRRTCFALLSGQVEVRLPGLTFQGFALKCDWKEEASGEGRFASGVVLLTVQGKEVGHAA